MRQVKDLDREDLEAIVQEIQAVFFLDDDGENFDPDKECGSDALMAVVQILNAYSLVPTEMRSSEKERPFSAHEASMVRIRTFAEMQSGPNPLSTDEIRALAAKRPWLWKQFLPKP